MAFTPENIASACILSELALSPDGSKVIYRVAPTLNINTYSVAALWYSPDISRAGSAVQLTSGLYNDGAASWLPYRESSAILFLSDRHQQGGPRQIYEYLLNGPTKPRIISELFLYKKIGVEQYQISPDGSHIAFCSADEPSAEDDRKARERDDARVWGQKKGSARLRIFTVDNGKITTLSNDNGHVISFTWNRESKKLLYLLAARLDAEALYEPTSLHVATLPAIGTSDLPIDEEIIIFNHAPTNGVIWPSSFHQELYTMQAYDPCNIVDALVVHRHWSRSSGSIENGQALLAEEIEDDFTLLSLPSQRTEEEYYPSDNATLTTRFKTMKSVKGPNTLDSPHFKDEVFYGGETDDAFALLDLQSQAGEFAVGIASGMSTRVDILNRKGKLFTLFDTNDRAGCRSFDVKKVGNEYVMAAAMSSGPDKQPPDVWIGKTSDMRTLTFTTKLSSHYKWVGSNALGLVKVFDWKGEDGIPLQGMVWFPKDFNSSDGPLPTVLYMHGGPYSRDVPELSPFYLAWPLFLAEHGFLVLTPNYRGSSGRGHAFARSSYHRMGTLDWSDANSMVDETVKRGWADSGKLGIGGWSMGGYLTSWGITQTKNKFKCGVVGAGVSDWGSLTTESALTDLEAELGGAAPWIGKAARLAGDPIRHLTDVETAILILHGEQDPLVPVGQSLGMHKGLRKTSRYPGRHTLVTYPREGHVFSEHRHGLDVMKRVLDHFETWLK